MHYYNYYLIIIISSSSIVSSRNMRKMSKTRQNAAFRRLCKSLIALLIVSVASHYKINTFIMSKNMSDMTWRQQWRHLLS